MPIQNKSKLVLGSKTTKERAVQRRRELVLGSGIVKEGRRYVQ